MWIQKLKQSLHSDFSFREDTTLSALPLVIAFLTLLSICMTHSAAYIKHVTINSSQVLSERLHLHIPHDVDDVAVKQLHESLATLQGVESVTKIPQKEINGFLNIWLGMDEKVAKGLPVPTILDIILYPEVNRDRMKEDIRDLFTEEYEDALLESYDESIASFNRSSQLVKNGIYILGFIVIASTTLIVVVTSRINLGVHARHIEILHHLGASDAYINRQFIKRAAIISLQGVVVGTLLSVAFIETITANFDPSFLPGGQDAFNAMWIYYILNPVLLVVLVLSAAWVSIEAQLKKMH